MFIITYDEYLGRINRLIKKKIYKKNVKKHKKKCFMKKKLFKIAVLFCIFGTLLSCKKEQVIDEENFAVQKAQSKPIVSNTKGTSTWNYYTAAVPIQINHSITSGSFMIEVGNTGTRCTLVNVYPKNGSNVDYGNMITAFSVNVNLGYCVIKTLYLPSSYDGIAITLTKDSPSGGYINGTVSVTR